MDHSNITKILDLAALTGTITNLYLYLLLRNWDLKVRINKIRKSVPEFIDPVFPKTSPKRSFSMSFHEILVRFQATVITKLVLYPSNLNRLFSQGKAR